MGELCKTSDEDRWDSFIAGTKEGSFTVTEEDDEGYFKGLFSDGTVVENIRGKCDGLTIYFLRSADKPRHYYTGRFEEVDGVTKIFGSRTSLPITEAKEDRLRDEEWEGTKVPTEAQADPARASQ